MFVIDLLITGVEYEFKKEIQKHFTYVISVNRCSCSCCYALHKRRRCLDLDRRRREMKNNENYLIKVNEREQRRNAHSYFYNSHTLSPSLLLCAPSALALLAISAVIQGQVFTLR